MDHVVSVLDCAVVILGMVVSYYPLVVVIVLVEVDLHVVVLWRFRHLVVTSVVIESYELVVLLCVRHVRHSSYRLTVRVGVCGCEFVLAVGVPLAVLVVLVLGI